MSFNVPIVFIIYNRPETTQLVFAQIKKIQPKQLFIIGDGPKNSHDEQKVKEAREVIHIDWPCDFTFIYSENNLGCMKNIVNGLNHVFTIVDTAIFLEDDCLPSDSFFQFCDNLLERYENDKSIMHISGFNIIGSVTNDSSYFHSKFILPPWGWATWKRSWKNFNLELNTWQEIKTSAYKNLNQEYFNDWTDMFENIRVNKTTWDVPWNVDIWKNNGLGIIPTKNLVQNIGFGKNATFTKNPNSSIAKIKKHEMEFPLIHPTQKNTPFDHLIEKLFIENLRIQNKEEK